MMGFWWTKSCKIVTGKLTTHLQFFFLKDLTWSDNNMYLGPVVVAQQVLDPSPQKEKWGGHKSQDLGIELLPQDVC